MVIGWSFFQAPSHSLRGGINLTHIKSMMMTTKLKYIAVFGMGWKEKFTFLWTPHGGRGNGEPHDDFLGQALDGQSFYV